MRAHITEVVEGNYRADPERNRAGRKYPRTSVYVKTPWLATPKNEDPITPHPIPVFLAHQHAQGRLDWEPLKPGTRVVVIEVDVSAHAPTGLAVIAAGTPNTDDVFPDLRETSEYRLHPGNAGEDRYVDEEVDPVFGPNEDVGRTHLDGRGYGWRTRHPYPGDATRDEATQTYPGTSVHSERRTDQSVHVHRITVPGAGVTYTLEFDVVAKTTTLMDDKGSSLVIDSNSLNVILTAAMLATIEGTSGVTLTTPAGISLISTLLGFYGTPPVPKPVVVGSTIAVNGAPVTALQSLLTALAALGLITNSAT